MNPSDIDTNESVAHRSSRQLRLTHLQHYALAVLSVGVALGASLLLQHFHFRDPALPLLLFAVAISSWYGGTGPAVLAVALSIISFYWYFVEPVRTPYIYYSQIPFFIIFVGFAALLSWFGTVRRRVEADLRRSREMLREQPSLLGLTDEKANSRLPVESQGRFPALRLALIYTFFGALWILLSDRLSFYLVSDLQLAERLQTYKGWFFIAVTSVLLWSLAKRFLSQVGAAEETSHRLNRKLQAISDCNQILLRATDEQSLLEKICRIVCEEAGYRMAFVGFAEDDEAKSIRPVAWTGAEEGYLANVGLTWADSERGRGPTGTAIRSGQSCCIQDFATDRRVAPWKESALQHGYRSSIALPLKDEHAHVFGSLTIFSAQPNAFTSEEIRLLEELAGDLAFGIVTLRSQAARQRAEQALRESEANLNRAQEVAHIGSWHLDIPHNRLTWSDEVFRIFGVPLGTPLTYEAFLDMVHPGDRESVGNAWSAALHGAPYDIEHRIVVGGDLKWVRELAHVEFNKEGNATGGIGTVQDITERKRAEDAVRRSEAYLAEAQRLSHTGSWALDVASDKYVYVSEECLRIYGFDPQEGFPTREAVFRRIHPEDFDRVKAGFEKSLREKVNSSEELRILLPDGTVKHLHVIRHPVVNGAGDVAEFVGTSVDITERKRAEEGLRRSEAYLAEAQRLTHTGSWALDAVTREYTYWSEEMFRIFGVHPQHGVPPRETMGRRIHPEDRSRAHGTFEKSLREKVATSEEYRFVLPSGTVKHVHVIRHPVLNAAGDIVELVGTFVDITERKRAEEALRESETRFRTFVDHATDAFFMLDFEQGTIIDVNRCACDSLGYTREELIGRTPMAFDVDLDRVALETLGERATAGETVLFDRHRHRRKDGSLFPVEVLISVFWHGGRRFLLKVARDISDRVRADEQREKLRQLEADLAHIDRVSLMGELAASVAHEVNQPLSGIVSNASACLRFLAGDAPNLAEACEAVRDIARDGKRAAEIIARIRALTKRTAATRERLDLNETIREVLALVGDEARRSSVIVRTKFADELSPVVGDRVQLQQVVLNLVMNAIDAMSSIRERARELVITTRNIDADHVQATVEDSGIGLDPNAKDKIFDSFYTTKPGGMGMGLSISRSILQSHGGRLWATAKDGPGTMFHFTVPKYREEGAHARATPA